MSNVTLTQAISLLTEPFVRAGLYTSPEQALKRIIIDHIERQIAWAEAQVHRYEQKYKRTFTEWSKSLAGQASVADEDDWMEWEAALDMLESWQQVKIQVEQSNV
jgi:hypothetical protein